MMSKNQLFILASGTIIFGVGAYFAFAEGKDNGAVFMGLGTILAALSATMGGRRDDNCKEQDNARG